MTPGAIGGQRQRWQGGSKALHPFHHSRWLWGSQTAQSGLQTPHWLLPTPAPAAWGTELKWLRAHHPQTLMRDSLGKERQSPKAWVHDMLLHKSTKKGLAA